MYLVETLMVFLSQMSLANSLKPSTSRKKVWRLLAIALKHMCYIERDAQDLVKEVTDSCTSLGHLQILFSIR